MCADDDYDAIVILEGQDGWAGMVGWEGGRGE